jgi:hypothetical protein
MPVGFLTELQPREYGRSNGGPTPHQPAHHFYVDDSHRRLIASHRGDYNRLGFAVQLSTARFIGTFLEDLSEDPAVSRCRPFGAVGCRALPQLLRLLLADIQCRSRTIGGSYAVEL